MTETEPSEELGTLLDEIEKRVTAAAKLRTEVCVRGTAATRDLPGWSGSLERARLELRQLKAEVKDMRLRVRILLAEKSENGTNVKCDRTVSDVLSSSSSDSDLLDQIDESLSRA